MQPIHDPEVSAIYYTDSQLDEKIAEMVRKQILAGISEENIVSCSLKPLDFGKNIVLPLERGYVTMAKQILAALEACTGKYAYFLEHDVLYHPSHFDFKPPEDDVFYYNQNVWFWRVTDNHILHYDVNQLSGLCVNVDTAIVHWRDRVAYLEKEGYSTKIGFEPMTHNRIKWQHMYGYDTWKSKYPNVDIKHGKNLTGQRWTKEEYRNQQLLINWTEGNLSDLPGWNKIELI